MSEYLFVYGTLRPAVVCEELGWLVEELNPIGRGTVRGRLFDLGPYPGAVVDMNAETTIDGDLLELPANDQVLIALDDYEEYFEDDLKSSLFIRRKCRVTVAGCEIESWIYIYNRDVSSASLIPSGDYLDARCRSGTSETDREDGQTGLQNI